MQLKNLMRTGLLSGGFVCGNASQQAKTLRQLCKLLDRSGFDVLETVSFYNIAAFDISPNSRMHIARTLAGWLGWSHLAIAQRKEAQR